MGSTGERSPDGGVRRNFLQPSSLHCPGFCGQLPPSTANSSLSLPGTEEDIRWDGSAESTLELMLTHCKSCPWGMRVAGPHSLCQPCVAPLRSYDYMFLVFHAFMPFLISSQAVGYYYSLGTGGLRPGQRSLLWLLLQFLCTLVESSLALLFSLLLFSPLGQLHTYGCDKEGSLREWYSLLDNPVLDYSRTLHCSQELVYPLYSLPFVLYALNLLNLICLRPLLYSLASLSNGRRNLLPTGSFFSALWALPLLALAHSFLSGLLYSLFPHIALTISLLLLIVHLSAHSSPHLKNSGRSGPSIRALFSRVFCCSSGNMGDNRRIDVAGSVEAPSLLLALLTHLCLFAFSLVALALANTRTGQFSDLFGGSSPQIHWWTLLLALPLVLPMPALFFILTVRLTAPNFGGSSSAGGLAASTNRSHR